MLYRASDKCKAVGSRGLQCMHARWRIGKVSMDLFQPKMFNIAGYFLVCVMAGCVEKEIVKSEQDHKVEISAAKHQRHYNQGVAALRARDFDAALAFFQSVLESGTERRLAVDARYNIGMILLEKGDLEGAKTALGDTLTLMPNHRDALLNLGLVFEKMDRYVEAVDHYRQALDKYPEDVAIMNNLLVMLRLNRQYRQAEEIGNRLLTIAPDNSQALQNMSLVFVDQGKLAWAERLCLRALQQLDELERQGAKIESYAGCYNNLAIIYMRMGRYKEALDHFQKALDVDPSYMDTLVNLGVFFHKFRDYSKAMSAYQRVLAQKPDHYQALKGLAYAFYGTGKPEQALDLFSKVVQQKPDGAQCYFVMGEIYSRFLHDDSKAVNYYRQYKAKLGNSLLSTDPVHGCLRSSMDRLRKTDRSKTIR